MSPSNSQNQEFSLNQFSTREVPVPENQLAKKSVVHLKENKDDRFSMDSNEMPRADEFTAAVVLKSSEKEKDIEQSIKNVSMKNKNKN